jgi:hypothetical protein
MPRTIPLPENLGELIADPQRVRDAFALLNALVQMEVHLVQPANVSPLDPGQRIIRGDPPRLILPLPLRSPNGWAAASGTATRSTFATSTVTTAQLAERVKALIDDLRTVRILP